jgi:hypothetical protein
MEKGKKMNNEELKPPSEMLQAYKEELEALKPSVVKQCYEVSQTIKGLSPEQWRELAKQHRPKK